MHSLTPKACDSGMPRVLCANTTVSVTVTDINDDAPQFPIPVYRIDIFDDTPVGVVLQPVATDQDSGSNAVIRYALQVRLCSAFVSVTLLASHEPTPAHIHTGADNVTVFR